MTLGQERHERQADLAVLAADDTSRRCPRSRGSGLRTTPSPADRSRSSTGGHLPTVRPSYGRDAEPGSTERPARAGTDGTSPCRRTGPDGGGKRVRSGRPTPRAAPVRNSRHRAGPARRPGPDYTDVIRRGEHPRPFRRGSATGRLDAAATLSVMGRALVLNATDAPLAVVPARRAVVLVLKEKAEVVVVQRGDLPLRNAWSWRRRRSCASAGSSTCRTDRTRRSRAGRCSPVTTGAASTAAAPPRTSTTSCRGRAAGCTCGRTSWPRAAAATRRRWTAPPRGRVPRWCGSRSRPPTGSA